jgi:hypothetical protein
MSENMEFLEKSVVYFSSRREARLSVNILRPLKGRYTVPQSGICGMTNGRGECPIARRKKEPPALPLCPLHISRPFYSALRKVVYYSAPKKFHKRGETFSV